jgi:hypothetical protein
VLVWQFWGNNLVLLQTNNIIVVLAYEWLQAHNHCFRVWRGGCGGKISDSYHNSEGRSEQKFYLIFRSPLRYFRTLCRGVSWSSYLWSEAIPLNHLLPCLERFLGISFERSSINVCGNKSSRQTVGYVHLQPIRFSVCLAFPNLVDIGRSCVLGYKLVKNVCGSKRIIKPVLFQNCNTIRYSLPLVYRIVLSVARFM